MRSLGMMPLVPEPLPRIALKVPEAAEWLGVHPSTIYRAIRDHQIPARKLRGQWMLSTVALERWLTVPDEELEAFLTAEDAR